LTFLSTGRFTVRFAFHVRGERQEKGTVMAATELPTIDVTVEGMTCEGCADKVRDALSATDGITGADIDVASGKVSVHHDGTVDRSALEFAIDSAVFDAGYKIV
jgi:copper chaperone